MEPTKKKKPAEEEATWDSGLRSTNGPVPHYELRMPGRVGIGVRMPAFADWLTKYFNVVDRHGPGRLRYVDFSNAGLTDTSLAVLSGTLQSICGRDLRILKLYGRSGAERSRWEVARARQTPLEKGTW